MKQLAWVLTAVLAGCETTSSPCGSGEELCDDVCVPTGLVCCNHGNGAVCPMGYTCGTSSSAPCLADNATVVTIEPPDASCSVACRNGKCPVKFNPSTASVRVDGQIYWRNNDSDQHILIDESTGGTPITTVPASGMSSTIRFTKAGTYTVSAMDCEDPRFTGYLASSKVVVTVAVDGEQ